MAGYRREELLDEESTDGTHIVFSSNLTSIGNPHFSSSRQLVLDDAHSADPAGPLREAEMHTSGHNENFSISFITSNTYDRKRLFWGRLTAFEKLLSMVIVILGMVIITLAIILMVQPSPLLQVHLAKDDQNSKSLKMVHH